MAALQGETGPEPGAESGALRAARAHRLALGDAMTRAEQALAVPSGSPTWREAVTAALAGLREALADHVAEVEGEQGLLGELRQVAPRLGGPISHLEQEHPELRAAADTALEVAPHAPVAEVRATVLDLLTAISRHRQRGADLVYEAYNVDIGGE